MTASYLYSSLPPEVKAERNRTEYSSRATGKAGNSDARDAVFEQLLRLAVSYASPQTTARRGAFGSNVRRSPLTEDIEVRAYHLYLGRGGSHGHDLDDWLQAERQVLEGLKKDKVSLRLALAFGLPNSASGLPESKR
jgi:hypothetical protein